MSRAAMWANDAKVEGILARLQDLKEKAGGDGGSMPSTLAFHFDADIAVLSRLVKLGDVQHYSSKKLIVARAVRRYWRRKRQGLPVFRNILTAELAKDQSRPATKWYVSFPVSIPRNAWGRLRWLTVGETRFCVRTQMWSSLQWQDWEARVKSVYPGDQKIFTNEFSHLLATAESRDADEAFRSLNDRYSLLRAAFNIRYSLGRIHIRSGGRLPPLAKLPSGPNFAVFDHAGRFSGIFHRLAPPDRYQAFRPTPDDFKHVRDLLRYFHKVEGRSFTGRLIATSFAKYSEALDAVRPMDAFLELWQVLDNVTHPELADGAKGAYNIQNVYKRAALLLPNKRRTQDLLGTALEIRNGLVHTGEFAADETDVSFLKLVVEQVLLKLTNLERSCPDVISLLAYFQYASANALEIGSRIRVLRSVQRKRK